MQLNDTKIQEFGRNDGIRSVFHCQDKFFISSYFFADNIILCIQHPGSDNMEGNLLY